MVPPALQSATAGGVVMAGIVSVLTTASVREQKRLLPPAEETGDAPMK
jgi:hypothetical protein